MDLHFFLVFVSSAMALVLVAAAYNHYFPKEAKPAERAVAEGIEENPSNAAWATHGTARNVGIDGNPALEELVYGDLSAYQSIGESSSGGHCL